MAIYEKPVRLLMKDMADAFALQPGHSFTKQQAVQWFAEHYPKIKTGTITAHLVRLSTNAQSRVHYNAKPGEDDLFFQLDSSHFRLYDPNHDPSPIYAAAEPTDGATPFEEDTEPQGSAQFAYESDLRNYLAKNLSVIEPGLVLYEEEGINGIEFRSSGK